MINKSILLTQVKDKFELLTFHSIVNECFINGLPLNKDEISLEEKKDLTKYSYKVIKTIGGLSAIESAIDKGDLNFNQKMKLADIYHLCTSSALEAAKRIVDETNCKDPDTKINEVVDKASFTDAEYKKFSSKAHEIGVEEMASIIQEKTLAVIKDEQEQYQKEEELQTELKDALADSKDFSNVSNEAYMDLFLSKNDPRQHVTLFSRLQDVSMEMMNVVSISNDNIMPIVDKVTFEAFLDDLRISNNVSIDAWMEAYGNISNEEVCDVPMEQRPKISTLVSIIVYTVMETLKTMNIYCPSHDSIKSFVSNSVNGQNVISANKDNIFTTAEEKVNEANKVDFSKLDSSRLAKTLVEFKQMSEMAQESLSENRNDMRAMKIVESLDGHIDKIKDVLHAREASMKAKANESFSYYDNLYRENDIAQFNKISNMFSKNTNVSEIRICVNPSNPSSVLDVACANESGNIVNSSFMNIQYAVESSQYIEYLKDRFEQSKLKECGKNVVIAFTDGSGKRIEL